MDTITKIRYKRKIMELNQRIESDEMDLINPNSLMFGIRILSFQPIIPTIPGWVKARSPRKVDGTELFSILYRSSEPNWNDAIAFLKKNYKREIHLCVPERFVYINEDKLEKTRQYFEEKEKLKQNGLMTTKSGRLRKTKYVYPPNCISSEDRSKFRRKMRRQQRKED